MSIKYQLQDNFLSSFFSLPFALRFYLTGGTALARFYFQHRESVDLDLFTNEKDIDFNEVNISIIKILESLALAMDKQVATPSFLQYITHNSNGETLKIDVVKDIPVHFGQLKTEQAIQIDSLANIGSNKVLAIFGRTDAKDFVDLFWLVHEGKLNFDHLFSLAKQKDLGLTEFYLAQAINHVHELREYPKLLKPLDIPAMTSYFTNLADELLRKIRPKE